MRRASAVGAVGVMALVIACGGPPPDPASIESPRADGFATGEPVSATNQADGVLVTLALSSGTVTGGERIGLKVSALNAGLDDVTYMSGGCGATGNISIEGAGEAVGGGEVGAPPQGTGAADILALARWSALSQAGEGIDWIREPGLPEDVAMGCPANLDYATLGPAETISGEWEWTARTEARAPLAPGTYRITFTFPLVGRGDVQPDAEGNMPVPGTTPSVTIPVEVTPGPKIVVTAAQAVDAAVADPQVLAWAERRLTRREDLTGGSIAVDGDAWRFAIGLNGGEARIWVDATTGEVLRRELP